MHFEHVGLHEVLVAQLFLANVAIRPREAGGFPVGILFHSSSLTVGTLGAAGATLWAAEG